MFGISFSPQITLGEILVLGAGALAWYAGYIRQGEQIRSIHKTVEALKRGQGLILGEGSNWPDAVRRCFGYGRHGG